MPGATADGSDGGDDVDEVGGERGVEGEDDAGAGVGGMDAAVDAAEVGDGLAAAGAVGGVDSDVDARGGGEGDGVDGDRGGEVGRPYRALCVWRDIGVAGETDVDDLVRLEEGEVLALELMVVRAC